jgi:hypothetical protein
MNHTTRDTFGDFMIDQHVKSEQELQKLRAVLIELQQTIDELAAALREFVEAGKIAGVPESPTKHTYRTDAFGKLFERAKSVLSKLDGAV